MRFILTSLVLIATSLYAVAYAGPLVQKRASIANTDPNQDSFYKAPSNLATYKPGQVIRSRKVTTTVTSSSLKQAYQLYFRTTNTQGGAEGTVATVFQPTNPKTSASAQILSYHAYEDSDSFDCAPSWALVQGSMSKATGTTGMDLDTYVTFALGKGVYAVVPDDEGSVSAFIGGHQEAYAALDGVRATKNFFKIPKAAAAGAGYSGGASVTVWFAELAGSYAPDLKILGVAHGGKFGKRRDWF